MTKQYLTDRKLKALKPAASGKTYVIWDGGQDHLGVRVGDKVRQHALFGDQKPRPTMTFTVLARLCTGDRPLVWHKLGRYPEMKLADARAAARDALRVLAAGKRPKEIVEEQRREQERRRKDTFGTVADDFIKRHVSKLRTARAIEADIRRKFLGQKREGDKEWIADRTIKHHWRDRPITEITRRDAVELIERIVDTDGRYAAFHALAYLRKLFNWALARETYGLENSPCARIRAGDIIGEFQSRDRVLEDHELRLIWHAAKEKKYPFGTLIQALMLTGQRLSEIGEMRWREIDSDNVDGAILTIPAERMKNKQAHSVPFSPRVVALLEDVPRFDHRDHDFVFSTMHGERPISGFSKAKVELDKAVAELVAAERKKGIETKDVAPWRIHDLRRTVRTRLSGLAVLPLVAELVMAHKQAGIHAVYDLHRYDAEKRDALLRWESLLVSIVEPRPPDEKVADLNKARAKRRSRVAAGAATAR